jgi:hypothetical protein
MAYPDLRKFELMTFTYTSTPVANRTNPGRSGANLLLAR